ncbi:hypothetical protein DITRI_Ditri03aG0098500 [Diplodiscus trichospermus]
MGKFMFHTDSRLSFSLKKVNLRENSFHYLGGKAERNYMMGYLSKMRKSANDQQLPTSTSSVKFADMNEEEWNLFYCKVQRDSLPCFCQAKVSNNWTETEVGDDLMPILSWLIILLM